MAFALEKLVALTWRRGRRSGEMPRLRRADAHPDNSVRRPILAQSELEPDLFTGPLREALADMDAASSVPCDVAPVSASLEGLTLLELARRLETALTRKLESDDLERMEPEAEIDADDAPKTLAEMAPARRVPVKAAVDPALDRALRQALDQLRGA